MRLPSPHLALVLIAAWCFGPSMAAAQMTLAYESPDPNRLPSVGYVSPPLGAVECDLTDPVRFRLSGLDSTGTFIDIWSGPGTTDCSTVEARNPLDGTCTHVTVGADTMLSGSPSQANLDIYMNELVNCAGDSGGVTIWFLLANTTMSTEAVTLSASLQVTYDKTPPSAPMDLGDSSGDSMATISWTQSPETDVQRYDVYGDGASVSGSCDEAKAATSLVAGGEVATGSYRFLGQSTGSTVVINPGELGLDFGQFGVIVVVATDQGLNQSVASNLACVARIETQGFCDAYGECESCTVAGRPGMARPGGTSLSALSFIFAVGLGFARRRRK